MEVLEKEIEEQKQETDFKEKKNILTKDRAKVLVISKDEFNTYMIKDHLPKEDGYTIYDVESLESALKVLEHLSIDTILIEDIFDELDGYGILDRLSLNNNSRDIPKVLMLTKDYEIKKADNISDDSVEFIQKPLKKAILKKLIKKDNVILYKNVFEKSYELQCLYDVNKKKIIEANSNFNNFFGSMKEVNHLLNSKENLDKFIPYVDEPNYLNAYNTSEWMDLFEKAKDFAFSLKVNKENKSYSFNVTSKSVDTSSIHLVRLSSSL